MQPSLAESVERVAASPAAVRHLLQQLRDKAERDQLKPWGAWERTIDAAFDLVNVFDPFGERH